MNVDAMREQLAFFADKYNCDINNVMIGIINGNLYVWDYNQNANEVFKILEIIPN